MAINEIYLGDCLELMDEIPDKSIDLILCDLPYGTTACSWDSIIPFNLLWKQYDRVSKYVSVIGLFGSEPFSSYLRLSNIRMYRYDWIWKKEKPTLFQHSKNRPLQISENICIFSKLGWGHESQMNGNRMRYNPQGIRPGKIKKFHGRQGQFIGNRPNQIGKLYQSFENFPINILEFTRDVDSFHPTQKPVALLEYLIKTYSQEGDLVLDNCIGSGTTAIAAMNTNRNWIGIEKDPEIYEIAKNRIEEHKSKIRIKKDNELC